MSNTIKVTKQQIAECAFLITRKEGINAINARRIGKELNCSLQPVYYYFDNMDSLREEVLKMANDLYNSYIERSKQIEECSPYKAVGIAYIKFASEEKELFKLLFMRKANITLAESNQVDDNYKYIIEQISKQTGFDGETAKRFYLEMWIFSHGIATMIATNYLDFKVEEISQLLSDTYKGLLLNYKVGQKDAKNK